MKCNVLICSAGRRVELVQAFKSSLVRYLPGAKVFCTDLLPKLSPACHFADGSFRVPKVTDGSYIQELLDICVSNDIGLIVPTIDTELLVLAQSSYRFEKKNIQVIISSAQLIELCRDKRRSSDLFNSLNIECPAILNKENLVFPCFCKPYDGSCSVGAMAISSQLELTREIIDNPKNMFMELIPKSYCEYTVDVYYAKDNTLKCIVPRKRLEVRGGEVSKGVTKKHFVYDYLLARLSLLTGARGCVTFQFFVNEETLSIKGLEVNPRFGGGYPLSNDAGAHFTDWLVKEYLMGEMVDFFDAWEDGLVMLRYDAKVLIHENQ